MKKIAFLLPVVILCTLSAGAEGDNSRTDTLYLKSNMHCAGCENVLFEKLRFEKGVKDLKVDHHSNTVKIVYNSKKTNADILKKAVVEKGYKAEPLSEKDYNRLQ